VKLIYFGTAAFAVPALERMAEHVVLVVAQPDRPSGRGMKLMPSPVRAKALELGLPVETPEKSRSPEFVEVLRALEADALLVAAYGQILSTKVLESAAKGGINLHGSLLPKYRGAAPIQRAIQMGESETGVTLMQMDRGMDTGDMIATVATKIGPDETYGELHDRLAVMAADLADEWMPRVVSSDLPRSPQDNEHATMAPKILKEEAELDSRRDALEEYRRFRAFTPAPGAFLRTILGTLKLSGMRFDERKGAPGEIVEVSPNLVVAFANGSLSITELQPEGKKRMSGRDFANGARLKPGARLI
jgi:methionyl-tRNA formyltransferase